MELKDLKFDIREWNEWIKVRFQNKDFISVDELLNDYENLIFEIEHLEEKIQDLEQDTDEEPDLYDEIKNYNMFGC